MHIVEPRSVQGLRLDSVQSQQKIKVWVRKQELFYETVIWDF